ncbi:MAG: FAD:protein FMN transferase, partial [Christensenellales bacterium]
MKYKRTLALFLCLLLVLAAGCKENAPDASGNGQVDIRQSDGRYETQLFAMDTVMELAAYGTGARLALIEAADLIRELDALFSVTDTQSDIYRINHNAGQFTAVDERTLEVIEKSLAISRQTGGHFDITIFPVVQAWGFNTADPQVPDAAVLEGAVEKVGFEGIEIEGGRIRIAEGMGLDLGAVAKGYASQAVIDLFRQRGLESAMVSLGGNIQLLGRKPDDSPWKVGVRDPVNQNGIFCMLSLSDAAVVTSGSYIRYFTEDNVD